MVYVFATYKYIIGNFVTAQLRQNTTAVWLVEQSAEILPSEIAIGAQSKYFVKVDGLIHSLVDKSPSDEGHPIRASAKPQRARCGFFSAASADFKPSLLLAPRRPGASLCAPTAVMQADYREKRECIHHHQTDARNPCTKISFKFWRRCVRIFCSYTSKYVYFFVVSELLSRSTVFTLSWRHAVRQEDARERRERQETTAGASSIQIHICFVGRVNVCIMAL